MREGFASFVVVLLLFLQVILGRDCKCLGDLVNETRCWNKITQTALEEEVSFERIKRCF